MPEFVTPPNAIDGIYFNPVEGVAGTSWPIGTPDMPVNNLTDALTLMFSHNLKKLYLAGARDYNGTHTGANHPTIMTDVNHTFSPGTLAGLTINNITDGSSGVITANNEHTITVAALVGGVSNIWTTGDTYDITDALGSQPYRIVFDQNVTLDIVGNLGYEVVIDAGTTVGFLNGLSCGILTNAGTVYIYGDCVVATSAPNTGVILVIGDCRIGWLLNNTGAIYIMGNCHIPYTSGSITNGGTLIIHADCEVGGPISSTGSVSVRGDCKAQYIDLTGGGSATISGDCKLTGYIVTDNGTIAIWGSLYISDRAGEGGSGYIDATGGGTAVVLGDCRCSSIDNTTGRVYIYGNCYVETAIGNTAGQIRIYGHCFAGSITQTDAGTITINGDCQIIGNITNSDIGGTITIVGVAHIYGTITNVGTLTYRGVIPIAQAVGTYSFDESDAAEQTVLTLTITAGTKIEAIWLDLVNSTRNTTIRVKHKIDGTNYRTFLTRAWTTADDDGVLIEGFGAYSDVQVSLQCDGGGAGAIDIPYVVI